MPQAISCGGSTRMTSSIRVRSPKLQPPSARTPCAVLLRKRVSRRQVRAQARRVLSRRCRLSPGRDVFGLNCVFQPATFIRRAALESVGQLDDSLHYGFDTNLVDRAVGARPAASDPAHLAASREYGETKTSTGCSREPRSSVESRSATRKSQPRQAPSATTFTRSTDSRCPARTCTRRSTSGSIERSGRRALCCCETMALGPTASPFPTGLLVSRPSPPDAQSRAGSGRDRAPAGDARRLRRDRRRTRRNARELFRRRPDVDFVVFCTVSTASCSSRRAECRGRDPPARQLLRRTRPARERGQDRHPDPELPDGRARRVPPQASDLRGPRRPARAPP